MAASFRFSLAPLVGPVPPRGEKTAFLWCLGATLARDEHKPDHTMVQSPV